MCGAKVGFSTKSEEFPWNCVAVSRGFESRSHRGLEIDRSFKGMRANLSKGFHGAGVSRNFRLAGSCSDQVGRAPIGGRRVGSSAANLVPSKHSHRRQQAKLGPAPQASPAARFAGQVAPKVAPGANASPAKHRPCKSGGG